MKLYQAILIVARMVASLGVLVGRLVSETSGGLLALAAFCNMGWAAGIRWCRLQPG